MPLEVNMLGLFFSNIAGLHLQSLLKKTLFKVYFQNSYFEETFFSEKHVVSNKMMWLKSGGF